MLNFMKKALSTRVFCALGAVLLLTGSSNPASSFTFLTKENKVQPVYGWNKFHSVPGKCKVSLPAPPEHVKQVMPVPEEGYDLRYDVYVSAFQKKAVYMMLVAQYPPFMNESYVEESLESFLNGLVMQNQDNKLIFADITAVQGYKALDFFIDSKGVYFKGRAIMANNNLYLLAMECEHKNYLQEHFNHFINSFEIVKQ